jgi:hypothetical protein
MPIQEHRYTSLPMTDAVMKIITESAKLLNSTLETLTVLRTEMENFPSQLPEYKTIMNIYGVETFLDSQLTAEIGDINRTNSSKSLVTLAGIDPPP